MKNKTLIAAILYSGNIDEYLKKEALLSAEEICNICGDDPEAEVFSVPEVFSASQVFPPNESTGDPLLRGQNLADLFYAACSICGKDINECDHELGFSYSGIGPCRVEVRRKS